MTDLQGKESFFRGVITGICLYQQKVITAHKRKEPIIIGDSLYYLQDGRERLLEKILNEICR